MTKVVLIEEELLATESRAPLQKEKKVDSPKAARRRRMSRMIGSLSMLPSVFRHLAKANTITICALWDAQPKSTVLRIVVGSAAVVAPVLSWWGAGAMVDVLARGAAWEELLWGAFAYTASLAVLSIVPVALSSLERMSDNATFELVFSKYTRKMITFRQEHLNDPVLSEKAKHVKERAVWRMMAMARTQPQVIRNLGTLVVTGSIVAVKAPSLLPILVVFGIPAMFFELRHAVKRAEIEEQLGPTWGLLWGDLYQLMVAQSLAMLHQFGAATWFALRYKRGLADASGAECRLEVQAATTRVLGALLVGVGLEISIGLLLKLALHGDLTVGEFVLVSGALSSLAAGLAEFASLLGQQWSQSKSIKDLTNLLGHPHTESISTRLTPAEDEYRDGVGGADENREETLSTGAQVTVENVWLRYASAEKGDFALKGISFSVPAGSVVQW